MNSAGMTVTLAGTGNEYLNAAQNWIVNGGSTLIDDDTGNNGALNFNNQTLTLASQGSGIATINFETAIGNNSTSTVAENGPNLVVNLEAAPGTVNQASFTLTSGTLNFATTASFNAFNRLGNGSTGLFAIGGGTIDNTSGVSGTLGLGSGTFSIGGNFTFGGANSLSFGGNAVALTTTPTITVNNNTLTVGGAISGTGFGITKAGLGTLALTHAETYTGTTTVNAGTLSLTGSIAGPLAVGGGTFTTSVNETIGGLTVNAGGSTINETTAADTLALGAISPPSAAR